MVKTATASWSRSTFGNIFQQIITLEDVIKVKEVQFEIYPTPENRAELRRAEKDLRRLLKIEEKFWKQNSGMKWFTDGDKNIKIFHSYVKERRRKLQVIEIQTSQGDIITSLQNIRKEAVNVFKDQFKETQSYVNHDMLECIKRAITTEQNEMMDRMPTKEEVKLVVFLLNGDSASGPDGFLG